MCIVHESEVHYLFQDILEAFEQSKMLSNFFLKRVGCLLCTCKKDIYYDSKSLISTQRSLYQWFDQSLVDLQKTPASIVCLNYFKSIVEEFKINGKIDSGVKITFLSLLKDLDNMDFSKLRPLVSNSKKSHKKNKINQNIFFTKLVKLKFDLKMCSVKEFTDLLNQIDNCSIKKIEKSHKCKIMLRDLDHLSLKNFMGEITVTLEASSQQNLIKIEKNLKQLADAVHYRLAKCMSSNCISDPSIVSSSAFSYVNVLVQSPTSSVVSTPNVSCVSSDQTFSTADSSKLSILAEILPHLDTSINNTLNDNDLLNISHDSLGTQTPKTSSPISSTSDSSLRRFKQSHHQHQHKKSNKSKQQQQQQQQDYMKQQQQQHKSKLESSIVNSNSAFENFIKASLIPSSPEQQHILNPKYKDDYLKKKEKAAAKKDKANLKKQEKMTASLKKLIGIAEAPSKPLTVMNNESSLNKYFSLLSMTNNNSNNNNNNNNYLCC